MGGGVGRDKGERGKGNQFNLFKGHRNTITLEYDPLHYYAPAILRMRSTASALLLLRYCHL